MVIAANAHTRQSVRTRSTGVCLLPYTPLELGDKPLCMRTNYYSVAVHIELDLLEVAAFLRRDQTEHGEAGGFVPMVH